MLSLDQAPANNNFREILVVDNALATLGDPTNIGAGINAGDSAAYTELDQYTMKLFTLLAMVEAQQGEEVRRREARAQDREAFTNIALLPMVEYARQLVKNLVFGPDNEVRAIELNNYISQDANQLSGHGSGSLSETAWSKPSMEAALNQPVANSTARAGSTASYSFLHRLFCKLGLLEPEAVGLTPDCGAPGH